MKPVSKQQIKSYLEKLDKERSENLRKGISKGSIDTKANRRMEDGLYLTICTIKDSYAQLSTRQMAKICGVNNVTIIRHGGPIAILKAWQKRDIRRITEGGVVRIRNLDIDIKTKFFYSAISEDHRTIDIMLVLGDKYFLDSLTVSFLPYIKPEIYGNFCYCLYDWLESWQRDDYSSDNIHWLHLAQIMNFYCKSANLPLYYHSI